MASGLEALSLSDFLVLAAAGMFVLGYLILDQILLRIMLLVGTALYIWYYAVVDDTPLWPAIWASVATGTANLIGLFSLLYRRSTLAIPKRYRDLYDSFAQLPPGDFRKLMKAAQRVTRPAGHRLTTAGRPIDTLYYVIDGAVDVEKGGRRFSILKGTFVGEVGYLIGNDASASTALSRDSELLEWNVEKLKRRVVRDPRFGLAMDTMISLDLAGKVARAGPPIQQAVDAPSTEIETLFLTQPQPPDAST